MEVNAHHDHTLLTVEAGESWESVTWKETACEDSSGGPEPIPVAQPLTVCGPASSATVWSAPFVKDGASLTGLTVRWKESFTVTPFVKLTVTEMLAAPDR